MSLCETIHRTTYPTYPPESTYPTTCTGALSVIQNDIRAPLSPDDIIKQALDAAPDESPKAVLNRLISDKLIAGADARRYLERLLGW